MDEIEWAKREEAPHVVEPCSHGTFLENQEQNIRSRAAGWGTPMPIQNSQDVPSACLASDKVRRCLLPYSSSNILWK